MSYYDDVYLAPPEYDDEPDACDSHAEPEEGCEDCEIQAEVRAAREDYDGPGYAAPDGPELDYLNR